MIKSICTWYRISQTQRLKNKGLLDTQTHTILSHPQGNYLHYEAKSAMATEWILQLKHNLLYYKQNFTS